MSETFMVAPQKAVAKLTPQQLQARCDALEASLRKLLTTPSPLLEPLPPELVRAQLAQQSQALEFSADAI